ncbi:MAG: hypothetical protein HGA22_15180, partial [Clostridiales bacterium]|nr:hypothetical protein [Clostridiales bacterium]
MNNLQFTPFSLPEWYTAERDTAKAIGRLDSVKELNYYINNPDDAVRRLAILRLSVLKPKDIELALRGVLDNPLESEANKELAAWAIKSSALKWNKDVLLSSRYLSRFTGEEKFDELFGVSYSNQDRWIGPSFDASILFRGLPAEAGDVYAMHSLDIDADFNTSEWLRAAASNILSGLKP